VSFHGLPLDEQTLIAWMSNWDYARELPHDGWRGSMSAARRLDLVKDSNGKFDIRQRILGLPKADVASSKANAGENRIELGSPALVELTFATSPTEPAVLSLFRADDTLISELTVESELIQHRRETGKVDHELYASNQRMPLPAGSDE